MTLMKRFEPTECLLGVALLGSLILVAFGNRDVTPVLIGIVSYLCGRADPRKGKDDGKG